MGIGLESKRKSGDLQGSLSQPTGHSKKSKSLGGGVPHNGRGRLGRGEKSAGGHSCGGACKNRRGRYEKHGGRNISNLGTRRKGVRSALRGFVETL